MTDYNRINIKDLRQIGKDMGLLRVDKNNKKVLIKRLKKGRQLSDYNKNVLLEHARNKGVLANAQMSKETILKKLTSPKLQDLGDKRLREIAKQCGVRLKGTMPRKEIIQRIEEPTAYYTIENLKRLAEYNNIQVRRGITKTELINRLTEANIISPSKSVEVSNIGVLGPDDSLPLIALIKRKTPKNAYEDLDNYRKYIQNIKKEYLTSRKLKQIQKTLEEKEKKAVEEHSRLFTPVINQSALNEFANVYTINGNEVYDGRTFLNNAKGSLTRVLRENKPTIVKLIFKCEMQKEEEYEDGEIIIIIKPFDFHSEKEFNLEGTDENELYGVMIDTIEEKIQKVERAEGTGWHFHSVISLELHTAEYIELPEYLKNKKAITNIKNDDDKCFLWCVLRALNPEPIHPERLNKKLKEKENTLNMEGIEYPLKLLHINKFEKQNETITITVFGYNEKDKVYPLRKSKHSNRSCKIKLLLIEKEGVSHYCLINDISRLVGSQVAKHKEKCFICDNCLNPFPTEESLNKHKEYCDTNECIKTIMPKKGSVVKFKNYRNSEVVPFVIYADIESLLEPIQSCGPNPGGSYTEKFQKHKPISFSYYIKCFDDNVFSREPRTYTGLDATQKFVESLEKDVKEIANIPEVGKIYKKGDLERYKAATQCWICNGEFDDTPNEKGYKQNKKVWDHCHFTGRFRGAAHSLCNLWYGKPKFIPVIFHNLSGYDSHLFIKNLGFTEGNIDCIPNNEEKYISFSKEITVGTYPKKAIDEKGSTYYKQEPIKYKIRFIDSFKFMSMSLNSLVSNLQEDGFNNLEKYYTGEKRTLLKRKGVYPYEYMDSLERLMENKLPAKKSFYSTLTGEGISVEDYQHALKVWKEFEIKTKRIISNYTMKRMYY